MYKEKQFGLNQSSKDENMDAPLPVSNEEYKKNLAAVPRPKVIQILTERFVAQGLSLEQATINATEWADDIDEDRD